MAIPTTPAPAHSGTDNKNAARLVLLHTAALQKLAPHLDQRLRIPLVNTRNATPTSRTVEDRAMVMLANADNKVEPRPVKTGQWSGNDWVILGGLKAGDKVIVDNLIKVRPGAPVAPHGPNEGPGAPGAKPGAAPAAPAAPAAKG